MTNPNHNDGEGSTVRRRSRPVEQSEVSGQAPPSAKKADLRERDVAPAHSWHSSRRAELFADPLIQSMVRDCTKNHAKETFLSMSLALFLICLHIYVAISLQAMYLRGSQWAVVAALVATPTVGAQCAFLLQALNHELGHAVQGMATSLDARVMSCLGWFIGGAGSSLCHIPWVAYYFGLGHRRHHQFTGSQWDVDGEALFWLWVPAKNCSPLRRFVWVTAASMLVPVAYMVSLGIYASYAFKQNIPELALVAIDATFTVLAHYYVGRFGAAYLFFASCCSMGFMCHPHITFWILQHVCVGDRHQPTISYYGSNLWNWLSLNELLHVEHHDVARITWRYLPQFRKLKPDLYDDLYHQASICSLIKQWIMGDPGPHGMQWDFGCKHKWGFDLPGGWAVGEVGMYVGATRLVQLDADRQYPIGYGLWCEIIGRDEEKSNVLVRFKGMRQAIRMPVGLLARGAPVE